MGDDTDAAVAARLASLVRHCTTIAAAVFLQRLPHVWPTLFSGVHPRRKITARSWSLAWAGLGTIASLLGATAGSDGGGDQVIGDRPVLRKIVLVRAASRASRLGTWGVQRRTTTRTQPSRRNPAIASGMASAALPRSAVEPAITYNRVAAVQRPRVVLEPILRAPPASGTAVSSRRLPGKNLAGGRRTCTASGGAAARVTSVALPAGRSTWRSVRRGAALRECRTGLRHPQTSSR